MYSHRDIVVGLKRVCGKQSLSDSKQGDPGTSLVLPSFSDRPGWGGVTLLLTTLFLV